MTTDNEAPERELVSENLNALYVPSDVDRRTFLMRSAVIGAATVITGRAGADSEKASAAAADAPPPPLPAQPAVALSPDLDVVKS